MRIYLMLIGLFLSSSVAWAQSGNYSQEGWIIRRTKKGIIKVPKKQKFRFEGTQIDGGVSRPSNSVLGTRVQRQNTSLIPVRTSFKEEFLGASGLQER
ncbi:hypothetical protein GW916_10680 [bacterium]|nr:hypothetical protein [bacterium]